MFFVSAVLYGETFEYVSGFIYSGLCQFGILSVCYIASFHISIFCLSITPNSSVVRNSGTSRPSRHYSVGQVNRTPVFWAQFLYFDRIQRSKSAFGNDFFLKLRNSTKCQDRLKLSSIRWIPISDHFQEKKWQIWKAVQVVPVCLLVHPFHQ